MFITYVVLDPRKPGKFTSHSCSFLFQPVYVGKGSIERAKNILKILRGESKKPHAGIMFHKWLLGMKALGLRDVPIIILDQESEDLAFAEELLLTRNFGLKINGGILFNSREGGDGGWSLSDHTRELLSLANTGANNPNWGTTWSDERRAKWMTTWSSKDRKRTPESMQKTWDGKNRTYEIIKPDGIKIIINDLTAFCENNNLPLSSFRKALKTQDGIIKGKRRKSKVEDWVIKYS